MTQIDGVMVGQRVARYRKLSKLSAQQLADLAGSGVSRGVIANLETGRRSDVGLATLMTLSRALRVPPIALVVPIERPGSRVTLDGVDMSVQEVIDWFRGWSLERNDSPVTVAEHVTTSILERLHELELLRGRVKRQQMLLDDALTAPDGENLTEGLREAARRGLDDAQRQVVRVQEDLAGLGVEL